MTTFLLLLKCFFQSILSTLLRVVLPSVTILLLKFCFKILFTPLCPIYCYRNEIRGLFTVNGSLARWLLSGTCPSIWSDATSRCNIAPTRRSSYSRNILFYDSSLDKEIRLIFVIIKDFSSCIICPCNNYQ